MHGPPGMQIFALLGEVALKESGIGGPLAREDVLHGLVQHPRLGKDCVQWIDDVVVGQLPPGERGTIYALTRQLFQVVCHDTVGVVGDQQAVGRPSDSADLTLG